MLLVEDLQRMGLVPPAQPGAAPQLPAPPAQPQRPMTIAQSMANSPGWAMASQGISNIGALSRGQQPGVSPMQAYQAHVAAKQKRAMDEFQSRPTSYQEWQLARQDGYKGSYADYLQTSATGQRPSSVREWEYLQGLTPEQQEQFLRNKRRDQIVKIGNVPGTVDPVTGEWTSVTGESFDTISERIRKESAQQAGAETGAQEESKFAWERIGNATDRIDANREAYSIAQQVKTLSENWKQQIADNKVDTGPINAFLLNTFGIGRAEMAELGADAIEQALNNLQIVNLAPVTEKEFGEIMKLWADLAVQETPNIGRLNSAIRRTENLMRRIEREARLRTDEIRSYNEAEADRILQYDPWLRGIVTPDDDGEGEKIKMEL